MISPGRDSRGTLPMNPSFVVQIPNQRRRCISGTMPFPDCDQSQSVWDSMRLSSNPSSNQRFAIGIVRLRGPLLPSAFLPPTIVWMNASCCFIWSPYIFRGWSPEFQSFQSSWANGPGNSSSFDGQPELALIVSTQKPSTTIKLWSFGKWTFGFDSLLAL